MKASTPAMPIDASGNTSRGQYTLLTRDRFCVMLTAPVDDAGEKKRPRHEADVGEQRVRGCRRCRCRPRLEEEREHHHQQQRGEQRPGEADLGLLVAGPEVAFGERPHQLAGTEELAQHDHGRIRRLNNRSGDGLSGGAGGWTEAGPAPWGAPRAGGGSGGGGAGVNDRQGGSAGASRASHDHRAEAARTTPARPRPTPEPKQAHRRRGRRVPVGAVATVAGRCAAGRRPGGGPLRGGHVAGRLVSLRALEGRPGCDVMTVLTLSRHMRRPP